MMESQVLLSPEHPVRRISPPLSKKEESNHEKDDEQDTTVEEANMWPAPRAV